MNRGQRKNALYLGASVVKVELYHGAYLITDALNDMEEMTVRDKRRNFCVPVVQFFSYIAMLEKNAGKNFK